MERASFLDPFCMSEFLGPIPAFCAPNRRRNGATNCAGRRTKKKKNPLGRPSDSAFYASCAPDFLLLLRYLKREREREEGEERRGAKKELTFMLIRIESCCGCSFTG